MYPLAKHDGYGARKHYLECVDTTGRCSRVEIVAQVLDSTYGQSVAGVRARLSRWRSNDWTTVASAESDHAGRIEGWDGQRLVPGLYCIVLESDDYFSNLGINSAYPNLSIVFRLRSESDVRQVRVVIAPCGYSVFLGHRTTS
jgi:5-hydroxyisourate hydrolase